jgi:hypothetical protein
MPRGGPRPGSGRKAVLPPEAQLWVGVRCEKLQRDLAETALRSDIDESTYFVREEWDGAKRVPASERKQWTQDNYETHKYDVTEGLRQDQGLGDTDEPTRVQRFVKKRPKGQKGESLRNKIIAQVAGEATDRFGVKVSVHMVDKCWKEFRQDSRATGARHC